MMNDFRILVITGFVILFILGLVLFIVREKIKSNTPGLALMIIGGFMSIILILNVLTTPSLEKRNLNDYLLFKAPPDIFKVIVLKPNSEQTKKEFGKEKYTITSNDEIKEIISSLHTAIEFNPNHPSAYWSFLVNLKTESDEITIEVDNTRSERNGTLITLWSSVTQGWVLGSYRCDKLGGTIEKILKAIDSNNRH